MIDLGLKRRRCKILFFEGQFSLGLQTKAKRILQTFCTNKGYYFSLNDFWHFWCVQCVKVKDTDNALSIKKGLQLPTMMIIIPFKFCPLQAAHT